MGCEPLVGLVPGDGGESRGDRHGEVAGGGWRKAEEGVQRRDVEDREQGRGRDRDDAKEDRAFASGELEEREGVTGSRG